MKIMNFRFIVLLVGLICLPGLAVADFKGGSGKGSITTVQEFKNQCNLSSPEGGLSGVIDMAVKTGKCADKKFILEGNIVAQLGGNDYQFKDKTGSINVEINDFGGIDVTPENLVRLVGEADYEDSDLILEVERIELVK